MADSKDDNAKEVLNILAKHLVDLCEEKAEIMLKKKGVKERLAKENKRTDLHNEEVAMATYVFAVSDTITTIVFEIIQLIAKAKAADEITAKSIRIQTLSSTYRGIIAILTKAALPDFFDTADKKYGHEYMYKLAKTVLKSQELEREDALKMLDDWRSCLLLRTVKQEDNK